MTMRRKFDPERIRAAIFDGVPAPLICSRFNCSPSTVSRARKAIRDQGDSTRQDQGREEGDSTN